MADKEVVESGLVSGAHLGDGGGSGCFRFRTNPGSLSEDLAWSHGGSCEREHGECEGRRRRLIDW